MLKRRAKGRRTRPKKARGRLLRVGAVPAIAIAAFWLGPPDMGALNHPDPGLLLSVGRFGGSSEPFPVGVKNPMWVHLGDISPALIKDVLAAEKQRHFRIAMKLASNLYLRGRTRGGWRLAQILLALKMERAVSRRRVMELYLNTAEWGRAVRGIGEASRHYYRTDPRYLSPAQSASLAARLSRVGSAEDLSGRHISPGLARL